MDQRIGKANYIIVSETAVTSPLFTMRGYASQGGRMDVIASSIMAAQTDPEPEFTAILMGPPNPPKILKVEAWGFSSERQVIAEILRAFKGRSRFIKVYPGSVESVLHECDRRNCILLEEDGEDLSKYTVLVCMNPVFILGGHTGIPGSIKEVIEDKVKYTISIGPKSLQTYQAILYLSWRRHFCRSPSSRRE